MTQLSIVRLTKVLEGPRLVFYLQSSLQLQFIHDSTFHREINLSVRETLESSLQSHQMTCAHYSKPNRVDLHVTNLHPIKHNPFLTFFFFITWLYITVLFLSYTYYCLFFFFSLHHKTVVSLTVIST